MCFVPGIIDRKSDWIVHLRAKAYVFLRKTKLQERISARSCGKRKHIYSICESTIHIYTWKWVWRQFREYSKELNVFNICPKKIKGKLSTQTITDTSWDFLEIYSSVKYFKSWWLWQSDMLAFKVVLQKPFRIKSNINFSRFFLVKYLSEDL